VTGPTAEPGQPGEPGWHPDPWNAASLRWWDGTQWSGKTAPIGTPPPPVAQAPASRHRTMNTGVIGGIGAAVVIVVVAVAALSGHSKAKTVVSAPTVTLAPIPTTVVPTGGGGLAAGVLALSDLPGGWTVKGAAAALPASVYTAGPCGSPLWAHDVAGYGTELADGGGSLIENAQAESQVLESDSPAATSAQAAYAMSPSYVDCVEAEVNAEIQSGLAGQPGIDLGGVTVDPLNVSVTLPSVSFLLDVSLVDPALGADAYVADDHIEVFDGPYEGTVDIITLSANPIAETLVQTEASAVAQHLAALPPGGTLRAGAV